MCMNTFPFLYFTGIVHPQPDQSFKLWVAVNTNRLGRMYVPGPHSERTLPGTNLFA